MASPVHPSDVACLPAAERGLVAQVRVGLSRAAKSPGAVMTGGTCPPPAYKRLIGPSAPTWRCAARSKERTFVTLAPPVPDHTMCDVPSMQLEQHGWDIHAVSHKPGGAAYGADPADSSGLTMDSPAATLVHVTDARARAERFADLFRAVYLTFHRRDGPRSQLPGASQGGARAPRARGPAHRGRGRGAHEPGTVGDQRDRHPSGTPGPAGARRRSRRPAADADLADRAGTRGAAPGPRGAERGHAGQRHGPVAARPGR